MNKIILIICSIIVILTAIIIFKNLSDEYIEEFELNKLNNQNNDINNSDKSVNKKSFLDKCIKKLSDPCPSRNVIQDEIFYLKDEITANNLKYDRLENILSEMENELSLIKSNKEQDQQEIDERNQRQHESTNAARDKSATQAAKPASDMSGLSEEESKEALQNHYSEGVTPNSAEHFKKTAKQPSKDHVKQHNEKMAKLADNQSNKPIDPTQTADGYINKNRALCKCPNNNSDLENKILNEANHYGFIQHDHNGVICSSNKPCAKKYASQKLKELCIQSGCKPVNVLGSYPYNLKKMNKVTKGTRPKGYNFPE